MTIDIRDSSWESREATALREFMDAEIRPRYTGLTNSDKMPPVDLDSLLLTLVAFDGDEPVATASLKNTEGFAEIKRVYVVESHRRQGLAALLLRAVADRAAELGFSDVVLQTGSQQPEAIALYEREGWIAIPPFGPYVFDTVISRCFSLPLSPLFVAVELPGTGDAATLVKQTTAAVRGLDTAGVDLVVLADDLRPAPAGQSRIDAPTLAAFLAPLGSHSGIAPQLAVTHTEPFHVAKAIQTLDHVSRGRGAWQVTVATSEQEARQFGRRPAPSTEDAWAEAEEAIEVAERLWDSWEDDAEIRDVATGRFIDRAKVHHIDFEGRFFSVRGPSIVPRSPQGRPPIIVAVPDEGGVDAAASADGSTQHPALDVAVRRADIIRVGSPAAVAAVRGALAQAGRSHDVTVLIDVAVASRSPREIRDELATLRHDTGADGAVLVLAETPDDTTELAAAQRPFVTTAPAGTLRDRLGLARPLSRYVRTLEGASA
jgi:alkanesulfonate monooxygenase SsuD/methylene tetrahydromethanopterin reductase-like flavin-dependent oxidoreductase (luciferase family)/GNAT superfamily N-acetyltransferase